MRNTTRAQWLSFTIKASISRGTKLEKLSRKRISCPRSVRTSCFPSQRFHRKFLRNREGVVQRGAKYCMNTSGVTTCAIYVESDDGPSLVISGLCSLTRIVKDYDHRMILSSNFCEADQVEADCIARQETGNFDAQATWRRGNILDSDFFLRNCNA